MQTKPLTRFFLTLLISNILYIPFVLAKDVKILTPAALAKTAQHKTYVGVVPYYRLNNKIYILLGRVTKDSRKVDAGVYADFGAAVKINDITILQKAVNVLNQDTMGKLKFSEQELIKSGKVVHKQVEPDHDVYYIFYKVSQQQFLKIKKFNVPHARLKASSLANTNLEKDQFVWFSLDGLLLNAPDEFDSQRKFDVNTIDGKQVSINLRKYFILDCLQNPELPDLMKSI